MVCEQVQYHDGGASFPQSTNQVTFLVPNPTDISEQPGKNIDFLTFSSKFIMHNASILYRYKKSGAQLSLASAPVMLSWSETRHASTPQASHMLWVSVAAFHTLKQNLTQIICFLANSILITRRRQTR